MAKEKKVKKYKLPPESDEYAVYTKPDEESDFAYTVVTTNGKPKTLLWSLSAFVLAIVSLLISYFGWAGIVVGIAALFLCVVAWKMLGFFNRFILVALIGSIFGTMLSIAFTAARAFGIF